MSGADRRHLFCRRHLPTGTVTFLFTDLEGSTRLLEAHPAAYRRRRAPATTPCCGGRWRPTGGRSSRRWGTRSTPPSPAPPTPWPPPWPGSGPCSGEPWGGDGAAAGADGRCTRGRWSARGAHYFGAPLYRCARLHGAAHGGQVVLSEATAALVRGRPAGGGRPARPGRAPAEGPGAARAGLPAVHPDLPGDFPPLRTAGRAAPQPARCSSPASSAGSGSWRRWRRCWARTAWSR